MWARRLASTRRLAAGLAGVGGGGLLLSNASQAQEARPPTEEKPRRLPIGGISHEIRTPLRRVTSVDPPLHGFYAKEMSVRGLPLRAHACVSDGAMCVAADRLSRMLRQLPDEVLSRLSRRGASFHIIGLCQGTSDLPEHAHMKGVDGGYTGEKGVTLDMRARGMGGVHSSCGEENLLDLDADPRYGGSDILVHEFAHCVMDVGLPHAVRQAVVDTYERAVGREGRWKRADGSCAYAGSCAEEYFAELTMWYFGSHGEFVDRVAAHPTPGPGGLAQYDPDGFALLAAIYGGTHPGLKAADAPHTRLVPAREGTVSTDEEEGKVPIEFDNQGCRGCAWKLFWITPKGEQVQYGEIEPGKCFEQVTFPGHTWLLKTAPGNPAAEKEELRYTAAKEPCVAVIGEDGT
ncbi:hypothetical protein AB1Y20_018209 [Prymnesium parvum]|uniref:von Hippel-Lindau disease tumour suppressor beta domain-containing protein n=1 Tax=Prymnesium parvum TaxID=97485 RepID=A0AB34JMT3_PRYPA